MLRGNLMLPLCRRLFLPLRPNCADIFLNCARTMIRIWATTTFVDPVKSLELRRKYRPAVREWLQDGAGRCEKAGYTSNGCVTLYWRLPTDAHPQVHGGRSGENHCTSEEIPATVKPSPKSRRRVYSTWWLDFIRTSKAQPILALQQSREFCPEIWITIR